MTSFPRRCPVFVTSTRTSAVGRPVPVSALGRHEAIGGEWREEGRGSDTCGGTVFEGLSWIGHR